MQHLIQLIHPRLCLLLVNGLNGDRASLIVVLLRPDPEHELAIPNTVQELSTKLSLAACQHVQWINMNVFQIAKESNGDH